MIPIPARLLRPAAENSPARPKPTERERARRDHIMDAGRRIFTAHGRTRVTLREFAVATGLTQIAIRNSIADLDHLFALILANHLNAVLGAIGAVQGQGPALYEGRRAEYLRLTRGFLNVPTPMHFLWLRERFTLPEDELDPLEQTASMIGHLLAGEHWQTALLLLDSPHLDQAQIEHLLAAHIAGAKPQQAAPEVPAPSPAAPTPSGLPWLASREHPPTCLAPQSGSGDLSPVVSRGKAPGLPPPPQAPAPLQAAREVSNDDPDPRPLRPPIHRRS